MKSKKKTYQKTDISSDFYVKFYEFSSQRKPHKPSPHEKKRVLISCRTRVLLSFETFLWSFHFLFRFFNEIIFCQHFGCYMWSPLGLFFTRSCGLRTPTQTSIWMKWNYFGPFWTAVFCLWFELVFKIQSDCLLVKCQCFVFVYAANMSGMLCASIRFHHKNRQIWWAYGKYHDDVCLLGVPYKSV